MKNTARITEDKLYSTIANCIKKAINEDFFFGDGDVNEIGNSLEGQKNLGRLAARYDNRARQAMRSGDEESASRYQQKSSEIKAKADGEASMSPDVQNHRSLMMDPSTAPDMMHARSAYLEESKLREMVAERVRKALKEDLGNLK